jgi:perosamine synthetase
MMTYPKKFEALATDITSRVRDLLGAPEDFVPLHEPEFLGDEEVLVLDCIRSGWVSSVGQYVDRFEAEIAAACGTAHGVAVVNGTAALEVALRIVGVMPGDEVLMPALTFIATANAAHHLGAVPHFVDAEARTLGLDPMALRAHLDSIADRSGGVTVNRRTGRRLAAVVPMHVFGHPVDIEDLVNVARDFNLALVEDAAESLGSRVGKRACGSFGRVAALSFNGNKILTTGGGGAVVTDDPDLARQAKHLTTTAKVQHKWEFYHDQIGYNYRMPNLNAALGVAQLAQLGIRLAQKRALAQRYIDAFGGIEGVEVFAERPGTTANYWLNTLVLSPNMAAGRDIVLEVLNGAGLMARPIWEPLHTLPIYADCPRADLSVTGDLAARIVNVPSSAKLAWNKQ